MVVQPRKMLRIFRGGFATLEPLLLRPGHAPASAATGASPAVSKGSCGFFARDSELDDAAAAVDLRDRVGRHEVAPAGEEALADGERVGSVRARAVHRRLDLAEHPAARVGDDVARRAAEVVGEALTARNLFPVCKEIPAAEVKALLAAQGLRLVRLRRHRPDGDQVGREDDRRQHGADRTRVLGPAVAALRIRRTPMPVRMIAISSKRPPPSAVM